MLWTNHPPPVSPPPVPVVTRRAPMATAPERQKVSEHVYADQGALLALPHLSWDQNPSRVASSPPPANFARVRNGVRLRGGSLHPQHHQMSIKGALVKELHVVLQALVAEQQHSQNYCNGVRMTMKRMMTKWRIELEMLNLEFDDSPEVDWALHWTRLCKRFVPHKITVPWNPSPIYFSSPWARLAGM